MKTYLEAELYKSSTRPALVLRVVLCNLRRGVRSVYSRLFIIAFLRVLYPSTTSIPSLLFSLFLFLFLSAFLFFVFFSLRESLVRVTRSE